MNRTMARGALTIASPTGEAAAVLVVESRPSVAARMPTRLGATDGTAAARVAIRRVRHRTGGPAGRVVIIR
jgi:hypothetical protein